LTAVDKWIDRYCEETFPSHAHDVCVPRSRPGWVATLADRYKIQGPDLFSIAIDTHTPLLLSPRSPIP
jgi:hypothetical protein